ncbi:MAG: YkgJ family cysteine cluster protein [Promethearchaeota archaeon]
MKSLENLKFECLRCGLCCHEVPNAEEEKAYKRIPLYPEEADRLEKLAKKLNIELHIIEDIVFPDIKNQKIAVLTYRILLDNKEHVCPFYDTKKGCLIQDQKPLACFAYPLAIKTIDAFHMEIQIDPLCSFTEKYYDNLSGLNAEEIKKVYSTEWERAKNMLKRNKRAILHLMALEKEGKIKIPKSITKEDYNKYLKDWDRVILNSL